MSSRSEIGELVRQVSSSLGLPAGQKARGVEGVEDLGFGLQGMGFGVRA